MNTLKGIIIGILLSITLGFAGYILLILIGINMHELDTAEPLKTFLYSKDAFLLSLPFSFILMAYIAYFSLKKSNSTSHLVTLVIVVFVCLTILIGFSPISIFKSYISVIFGGLLGRFIWIREQKKTSFNPEHQATHQASPIERNLKLRIRFNDALKITIKALSLPIILGLILAAYQSGISVAIHPKTLLIITATVSFFIMLISIPIALELNSKGLIFKKVLRQDEFYSWNSEFYIEENTQFPTKSYLLQNLSQKKSYQVPAIVFTYADVKEHIDTYAPKTHALNKIITAST